MGDLSFGIGIQTMGSNNLNATVRWTVAHARLDGHDTLIESIPIGLPIYAPLRAAFHGKRLNSPWNMV
jgi:hypothetical protein